VIRVERTFDAELIRNVLTHPKIYAGMGDDFSPAAADFVPPDPERVWYVAAWDGQQLLGLLAFNPMSEILFLIHCCLLPCAWGPRAVEAVRAAVAWMWEHSPAVRIIGMTPAYNRLALRLALRSGFKEFGVNPRCHQHGGVLWDEVLTGVSKWD
jgi:RimJ/RimL family protein N-acetyltransferase